MTWPREYISRKDRWKIAYEEDQEEIEKKKEMKRRRRRRRIESAKVMRHRKK